MAERVIRTLKEPGAHRQRFDRLQNATRIIGDGTSFYRNRRPHQAPAIHTQAEAFR